jgi:ribokinase
MISWLSSADLRAPIAVIGSVNQDLVAMVKALPGPGETVLASGLTRGLGGKGANQAVAASRLGAAVYFVGAVGADDAGTELRDALDATGVNTEFLHTIDESSSGIAIIDVAESGENMITVHPGANHALSVEVAGLALDAIVARSSIAPVIVVQGEIPVPVIDRIASTCQAAGLRLVLNLAPVVEVCATTLRLASPLVVNEHELLALARLRHVDVVDRSLEAVACDIQRCLGDLVVTLGSEGALVLDDAGVTPVPVITDAPVVDTTGAGDAFVGALAVALAYGRTLCEATATGVVAGSIAVSAAGTVGSYPDRDALLSASRSIVQGAEAAS